MPFAVPPWLALRGPAGRAVAALAALWMLTAAPAGAGPARAAPDADGWARWEAHDEGNRLHIDHGAWSEFLQRNLVTRHPSGINRLDYRRVSRVDRLILDGYVQVLAALPISTYGRNEQKAYWINLYNALTVRVVLAHYPVGSMRYIGTAPGLPADGPWEAKRVRVEGQALSLNDIANRILRPVWRDPRVDYALNRASLGGPNLAGEAYAPFNLERLLDAGARAYVNHPRGVHFAGERLVVSSLYLWYLEDFGGSTQGVLEHLRRYAEPLLAERLAGWQGGLADTYDWSLNAP